METVRNLNKHLKNNYDKKMGQNGNDEPIDLTNTSHEDIQLEKDVKAAASMPLGNSIFFRNIDNQGEIMKAAKSLFSKRTRTLYHWMYPSTPKFQLKSAVAFAWETMGQQEKQFYISQVLGKFGYLQSSLMVNPQLGSLPLPTIPELNIQPNLLSSVVETTSAVSNLLQEENRALDMQLPVEQLFVPRKRGRPRGSKRANSSGILARQQQKRYKMKVMAGTTRMAGATRITGGGDGVEDFNDDPELQKEIEQFQWALHLVDK